MTWRVTRGPGHDKRVIPTNILEKSPATQIMMGMNDEIFVQVPRDDTHAVFVQGAPNDYRHYSDQPD